MFVRSVLPGLCILAAFVAALTWYTNPRPESGTNPLPLIRGVNLVAPPREITAEALQPITRLSADWVAIVPYAFAQPGRPEIYSNTERHWWGERLEGMARQVAYANQLGLKVMLKPHVWVRDQGWPGDFTLSSEADWRTWEAQYEKYLFDCLRAVDSLNVDMICIGTEYRQATALRPEFWQSLIRKLRQQYSGKLTYAANWDEFDRITFWKELDYIGIDAYFPLSKAKTPSVDELRRSWKSPLRQIRRVQAKTGKPVLFTEYGYQSVDYATSGHWNIKPEQLEPNPEAQSLAFEALYQTFWHEPWFGGGFVWKWHCNHSRAGGLLDKEHTPQNKPAEEVIRRWYSNPPETAISGH